MLDRVPDLFSYIVKTDSGFCPNPYGGICTLACCKPRIRYKAKIGDWVIGTILVPKGVKLIYAMKISRALTFDLYWNYPEYEGKKPNKNNVRGDNIYKYGESSELIQLPNRSHSDKHFETDTSVNRVLISKEFYYFGKNAPDIPEQCRSIVNSNQGHSQIKPTSKNSIAASVFLVWLHDNFQQGLNGEPTVAKVPKKQFATELRIINKKKIE